MGRGLRFCDGFFFPLFANLITDAHVATIGSAKKSAKKKKEKKEEKKT